MTEKQVDNWFTYHAPTESTAPLYAAIDDAFGRCSYEFSASHDDSMSPVEQHNRVNAAAKAFALIVDANAPDSADKSAAFRCIRLARNAQNELIAHRPASADWAQRLFDMSGEELQKAKWQANSAIACGGA